MNKERLNEIKDSVNFQRKLLLAHNMNTLCVDEEQELINEIDRLNNIINEKNKKIDWLTDLIKISEKYLELIYDLGYDYDGCETTGDLKNLIDELIKYASLGRAYNITGIIYENNGKKYNILHEELKENK